MSRPKKIILGILGVVIGLPAALAATMLVWGFISDTTNGSVVSSGVTRRYLLYVPKTYSASQPAPLIISLHPAATWPAFMRNVSRWNELADKHGFIVVYPAGRGPFFGSYGRGQGVFHTQGPSGAREVRFISDLIDSLQAQYNIDRDRIYVNGMSNGGAMAYLLSCKLANRIAAVGVVAGALDVDLEDCGDAAGLPTIVFHGTADRLAPYHGGTSPVAPGVFPPVADWVARAARRNGCQQRPPEAALSSAIRKVSYRGCASSADVDFYVIEGAGHTWPGGEHLPQWFAGETTDEISATSLMWDFYAQHPRSK